MFDYPRKAEFNRPLPKSKIYQFARPTRAVRERMVAQVSEILWKYKLSPETIHLPARQRVEEIQVFVIALRTGELAEEVLRAMDHAIASPVFYELTFEGRTRFMAAYKRPNDTDAFRSVVGEYFGTEWRAADAAREPLPVALDLAGLYEQMLRRHMDKPARRGETLAAQMERVTLLRRQETECRRLETRLRQEVQFNRKVELNATLREARAALARLQ